MSEGQRFPEKVLRIILDIEIRADEQQMKTMISSLGVETHLLSYVPFPTGLGLIASVGAAE